MSKMGKYCKAYMVSRLQEFDGWADNYRRLEKDESHASDNGNSAPENDYLFLQENFTVTKGIFLDEDVVYDNVTPQWINFCENTLEFKIPEDA